jgi:hypothetical protein
LKLLLDNFPAALASGENYLRFTYLKFNFFRRSKMATKSTQSTFDFDTFNGMMKQANSGLKLYLAEQMLADVYSVMARFRSPLTNDMVDILDEIGSLREANKKYLATRENRGTDDTQLTPDSQTKSGDYAKE